MKYVKTISYLIKNDLLYKETLESDVIHEIFNDSTKKYLHVLAYLKKKEFITYQPLSFNGYGFNDDISYNFNEASISLTDKGRSFFVDKFVNRNEFYKDILWRIITGTVGLFIGFFIRSYLG